MSHIDSGGHSAADHHPRTMIDLLRRHASDQGSRSAYTFLVDGEAEKIDLTYEDLDRRSRAIGASLQLAGAAGERVLLLYPHGLEFITAFLGCLYAGAVAVPASPPRLNRSQLQLRKIIEDTGAKVALTTKAVWARAERIFGEAADARRLRWMTTDEITDELEGKWRTPGVDPDALAMIQYTSGSTNDPKGVMISHRNLLSSERMIREAFRQNESSIIVGWLPFYHDMGLIGNVLQPLYLGARCVLMSPTAFLQKPLRWLQAISEYRATTSGGPNFAYDLCVRKISAGERAQLDLSSWTVAFNGAEPIFHETLERFAAAFAGCGFRRESFHPCYGLAEATLLVSSGPSGTPSRIEPPGTGLDRSISTTNDYGQRIPVGCGQASPNERVLIVDPESLIPCPPKRIGEIWVSGPHIARGYWNRELETAETFGARLKETGEGPFLRTGDLGYIEDDELFVAGRIKDLIIIRGRNHYPQDLELTVQQSNPVLESGGCAAFSIEEAGEERLVIVQELSRHAPDPRNLIEVIREAVAGEHEVQAHAVVLINKGSLPKTTSGKVQRYACRNEYRARRLQVIAEWRESAKPGAESASLSSTDGPLTVDSIALSAIETGLQSFLAVKLGRDARRIDVNRPLLSYGVDSLTAIELSHHLESRYGIAADSASLLENATLAQLARQALNSLKEVSHDPKPSLAAVPFETVAHPLSYGQRSLWFMSQLAPYGGAYNVSSAVRIRSALDPAALKRALQTIVDRHDSLRTTFFIRDGEPLQQVHAKLDLSLPETEISSWSEESLNDFLTEEAHRPFDPEHGPLLRVSLFTRSPQDHILLIVAHHIVTDLWSMGVLIHELGLSYQAETTSVAAPLDPLPVQYPDYVYWQRELLAGREGERLWSYWQRRLAGELGTLNLPIDRPRPSLQTFHGDSQPVCLSSDIVQALGALGRNRGTTLYMTLQAIFYVLLHRYTAQEDLLIGSPMAGRNSAKLAGLIGYFVNPVALRIDLSGPPTFTELLERVRAITLGAFAHQDYPFALLVERLQPAHDPSRSPLFQVEFALQKAPVLGDEAPASRALIAEARMNFGGLSAESVALRRRASQFDLSWQMVETENGLEGFIEYNVDLFDQWRIRRMAEHFRALAENALADPQRRIIELELLSATETEQLIFEFNRTQLEYEHGLCPHQLFERQVERTPDAVAVVDRDRQLTYAELNARANKAALSLVERGVGPEVLVAILSERGADILIAILAVFKAGGAYLPLDPRHPATRLGQTLDQSGAGLLIVTAPFRTLAGEAQAAMTSDAPPAVLPWDLLSSGSGEEENPALALRLQQLAYVIFTSGSTGIPKGVMVEQRGMLNHLTAKLRDLELDDRDVVAQTASQCFDISVWQFLAALLAGGRVEVFGDEISHDPSALSAEVESRQVTILEIVPSMLRMLLAEEEQRRKRRNWSAVRWMIPTGEALPLELCRQWFGLYPEIPLLNAYGPTECSDDVTHGPMREALAEWRVRAPIGRPIGNTQIYVLNGEMRPQPVGVAGELYVGGTGVGRGYLNEAGKTAESFVPDAFKQVGGARLYRSGDLACYLPDGNLEYLGRVDHQVKIRGLRIELGEIEAVLRRHPSIEEVVVAAADDRSHGKRLVAYLVAKQGSAFSIDELRAHVKRQLPEYMAPETYVRLEAMPLTENGKLDRRALPAPEGANSRFVAPRTPVEQAMAEIWSHVLGVDRIGVDDDFFALGGHSLLATQAVSRMREALRVEAPLRALFEHPTINELARSLQFGEPQAPPLARASRTAMMPLSFAQRRLWFIEQLEPGKAAYNCPGAVKLEGRLDLEALERVVNEIVRRHEALRTRIEVAAGEPVQVIDAWEYRPLAVEDLTAFLPAERDAAIRRAVSAEAGTGFDLERGPMLRVRVLKLEAEQHVMFFTMHHIVSDEWSIGVLAREIGQLYEAISEGAESPLPELEIQYADYAKWQRDYLAGGVLEREAGYWKERLKDVAVMELPADRPRPAASSYRGGREKVEIGRETCEGLRKSSRREGATLFMTLMAAFKVLLMRYSGAEDVVVGTVIANRTRREIERLIGFFVNTLVMRTDLGGNPSFRELVEREREVALGAYAHQEAPFEKLVEEINPERDLSRSPLFQVMMILQNLGREELKIRGVKVTELEDVSGSAKFDLTLMLTETGEGLTGYLEYSQDIYEGETIRRMARHYEKVVVEVVEDAERKIREIDLLTASEREQIVVEWNATATGDSQVCSIHELIEAQVELQPESVAAIHEEHTLSYRELNRRANLLAHHLQRLGVGPEALVGVCEERGLEMIVSLLGILKTGAGYLPLDPAYPAERLRWMLEDGEPPVVLTQARLLNVLPEFKGTTMVVDRDWPSTAGRSDENPLSPVASGNPAYVIYTSGSTGRPKGVIAPHRQVINFFAAMDTYLEPDPAAVWLALTSVSFDISVLELLWTLARGFRVVIQGEPGGPDGLDFSIPEQIARHRVSHLQCTPSMARLLQAEADAPGALGSLRQLLIGGEAFPLELAQDLRRSAPAKVRNLYGPTETTIWSATYALHGDESRIPIGRPIANTRICILDRAFQIVPVGVPGELYIGGRGVVRGYLRRPDLTAERFLPDSFNPEPGSRLYRTGDLARYLPDGDIEFLGRADYQVKIRGFRIEPGEIEALLACHSMVGQAVVVAHRAGAEEAQLVAYLVCKGEGALEDAELRRYLKERLPEYMLPARFVRLERLPLTPNGKVDRRALPAPEATCSEGRDDAPRTPVEELLVGIFREVLRLDRVEISDNFFEIGGHSLLATQIVSRVREVFGAEIGVRSIFEEKTIDGLRRRLEEAIGTGASNGALPLLRAPRNGSSGEGMPLSFAQQRLWFIEQLNPGAAIYNCPGAVRLKGELDLEVLERVIEEIVRRHEALRTRIEVAEGEPVQAIDAQGPRGIERIDLTGIPREEREAEARRATREEAGTGFDLRRGPLIRVKVLKLEEDEHLALFTMHHIVSDGWSMEILIREVGALYRAFSAGAESPLPELPIQYADFAVWQRSWLKGEVLEKQLEYWRKQLTGMEDLDLPTDYPRPAARSHRGSNRRFMIERELSERLRDLSRRAGATLFMTLLGGFDVVMSRYSGQDEIVIGTDIANRNRKEIEPLIGFFVNQLVLRVGVSGSESFGGLLKRVREACLGAYAHQDAPFEKLVEELQPERDLSRSPLFQAKLLLQNAQREGLELGGVRLLSIGGGETQTARFDLTVAMTDEGETLTGEVEYSRDLFEEETIGRLMIHYTNVLRGAVEDSERPISELSLLSEGEREQIVVEWNRTKRPYPQGRRVHELFAEQVERIPDRLALIGEGQSVSYGEVNRRANQLGRRLRKLGVGPEVVIGLCLERSVEMIVAVLGVLKAGGAYLPLDPEHPLERLNYMLENAGVGVLLTQSAVGERLPSFWGQTVLVDEEWDRIGQESESEPESGGTAENLAYLIYTSGSTGRPKGVMLGHAGLRNLAEAQKEGFGLSDQSRVLQFASLSFDASVSEIFSTLLAGGSLHVHSRDGLMPGEDLAKALREERITAVTLPPAVLAATSADGLCDLQTIIAAGEACGIDLVRKWGRGRRFINAYGPTEATVCATMGDCEADGDGKTTIGRPIANVGIYLLDDDLEPAPVGARGEMYIAGAGVARGYIGSPDQTAERFIPNSFGRHAGERIYRTGDAGRYLPDGRIEFIGRRDEQVKINGNRIEPGEIASLLCEQAVVRQAAVVAREDEPGQRRLVAYVVTESSAKDAKNARTGIENEIELWPSVAEYFVYDDALYYAMTHDERRNLSYRVAVDEMVRDKIVLDVGTGADAVLARMCVEAGAKKVYAIELLEESYRKAGTLIHRLGLEDRIELIHGDSTQVQLPEGVDVCISEIVGSIGGCEGAGRILNDARRFLKSSGLMIPCRSATLIAAARLPEVLRSKPRFSTAAGYYAEKIFEQIGRPFDLRVCIKNFPIDHVISDQAIFEDLNFNQVIPDQESHEIDLKITEHAILDGFLIWLTLYTTPNEVIDILRSPHSWLPVFFPVFYPGLEVQPGDAIKAVCSYRLCAENGVNPDYRIEGQVIRRDGENVSFCYQSPHFQRSFRSSQFYFELFGGESVVEIEPNRKAKNTAAELRKALEQRLPSYMLPSAIVLLDGLPLTPNGKLNRQALPAPELGQARGSNGYAAARSPVEEIVAGIYEEVLKVDRVGIRDDFFEAGGHSLLATQVVSRIRMIFGIEMGVRNLFEDATVEGVGRKIEEAIRAGASESPPPLVRASGGGRPPLSFAQQRLWFIEQLDPGKAVYNSSGAVRLEGRLKLDVLERVINEIINRHEMLRTRIEVEADEPVQVVEEWRPLELIAEVMAGSTREEREEKARRVMSEESRTGFDLKRGPLMRVKVLKLDGEQYILLFTLHHIVSDGWSMGILIKEVKALYQAYSAGAEPPLPKLKIQYSDYARWQRLYLTGAVMEKHLTYWKKQLGENLSALDLPADRPRPVLPSYRGAIKSFSLPASLSQSLRSLSRREGVTLFMTLLAAFKTLLYRYTGREEIVIGTAIANRNRAEIEPLIGFFVNMLPLKTDLSGNPKFRELLGRVKEVALGGYAHQDLPFEKLVEELQPERAASQMPFFNIAFGVQNAPVADLRLNGIKITPLEAEAEAARLDLTLWATEDREEIRVAWTFSTDLFEEERVIRMQRHFETLLHGIVERPDARLTTLEIQPDQTIPNLGRDTDVRIKRRKARNPSSQV